MDTKAITGYLIVFAVALLAVYAANNFTSIGKLVAKKAA
jgi:hypothetical protein